jgi:hypothetical protein
MANVLITVISDISRSPCLLEYSFMVYDTIVWQISKTVALSFLETFYIAFNDMSFENLTFRLISSVA